MCEIEHLGRYKCKVKLRPSYDGRPLKDGAKALDGKILILQADWVQDDDDQYPGEWALSSIYFNELSMITGGAVSWISSGDVEILGAVDA